MVKGNKINTRQGCKFTTNKYLYIMLLKVKIYFFVFQIKENVYACEICLKTFNSSGNARKHVKIHGICIEPVEDRTCPHCGIVFRYAELCQLHIKRTCIQQRSPRCEDCNIVFPTRLELKENIRTVHEQDERRCSHCDFVALSVRSKLTHEKTMHLNLKCKQCKKIFPSESSMLSHECKDPENLHCSQCDKVYSSRKELKDHVNFVHNGLKYACHVCNTALATEKYLKRHILTVHQIPVQSFLCPEPFCGKSLKDQRALYDHVKTHNLSSRSEPCPDCGKILATTDSLRRHMKIVHKKELQQVCEDCGKIFPSLSQLRVHGEMVHMQGIMQLCQLCGKDFLGENRLRIHIQRNHPKELQSASSEHHDKVRNKLLEHICSSVFHVINSLLRRF